MSAHTPKKNSIFQNFQRRIAVLNSENFKGKKKGFSCEGHFRLFTSESRKVIGKEGVLCFRFSQRPNRNCNFH